MGHEHPEIQKVGVENLNGIFYEKVFLVIFLDVSILVCVIRHGKFDDE